MRQKRLAVAIVADDLTGALDAAAPFASHGLDTWLTLPRDRASRRIRASAEVVALTTESRHEAANEAANRVEAAVRVLTTRQPKILFKKIDSILRGNIGAEVVTALMTSGRRHAIIAPAVPTQDRTMRGGTVYVNGVQLPAGAGGEEPLDSPASAHLPDLLRPVGCLHVHMVPVGQGPTLAVEPGLHAYVIDADSEADLDATAQFVIKRSPEILPVGAMGLGRALARAIGQDAAPQTLPLAPGALLFVIGSRREPSKAQIEALRLGGAIEIEIPTGPSPVFESLLDRVTLEHRTPLLVVRPELTPLSGVSPQVVAGRLGRAAAAIVDSVGVSALVMTGGDTSAACLECLGAECLHVLGELHDGIAYGTFQAGPRSIPFFTKSGSFGRSDTWTRLAELLQTESDA